MWLTIDHMHAGELETSILLVACPSYVRDGWNTGNHHAPDRRYLTALGMHADTQSGVIGQPSQATVDKGFAAINHLGHAAGTLLGLLTHRQD